nr:cation/H(+) antiporter 15-like [Coffea arabica]
MASQTMNASANIVLDSVGNRTLVCHDPHKISSNGLWTNENPLNYSTPLLLMQLSLVSLTSMLIDVIIKPLGQSTIVSQIFGGIIFGASLLGHVASVGAVFFPPRGQIIFETFSTFGLMFFLFSVAVKMDPKMMIRPGWKPAILGLSAVFTTLVFSLLLAFALKRYASLDPSVAKPLPVIAAAQCLLSFQNVASVLTELKMIQTDLGRLAVSSAMFCDLIGICFMASSFAVLQTSGDYPMISVLAILVFVIFVLVSVYIIRPLILKSLSLVPEGRSIGESHITAIFTVLLVVGFISEMIGQHFMFGPMVIGLVVPEGPPLGAALTAKLDIPVGKILYPAFLTASGLKTDIFCIHFQGAWTVALIVFLSCVVKVGAVMLPACYMDLKIQESFVLGLMMNVRGLSELVLYNLFLDVEVLKPEAFALCVVSVILVTAITTLLIKLLYDPSSRLTPVRRRTIQHCKRGTELRILVCIHNQENVPAMVNLLEASNATEESPVTVIAVLLIELVGRANPMLIAHQSHRLLQPSSSRSGRIINALRQYELCNEACVTFQSFSSISQFDTMHEDVCRVALDQNTNIIILPFHKQWEIDGSIGSVNRAIQNMNAQVIEKSPCSVAVLVDRTTLRGSRTILNGQSSYHVAVIFIGGADDAESLSYAARMVMHPHVSLTVFRFLLLGSDNMRERKIDNNLIDEIRHVNIGNERFAYQEEIVRDSVGLAASATRLGGSFDLILVGRNHQESPLLEGLGAWIGCPELGVIGDMLAEPDFERTASILVVQQQRLKGKVMKRISKPVVIDQEPFHAT